MEANEMLTAATAAADIKGLTALYQFVMSPPIMTAVAWWLVRRYFGRQESLLTGLSTTMDDIKLKVALYESKATSLDDALKNAHKMQEKIVILESKLDAAFRLIDRLTLFEKDVQSKLAPQNPPNPQNSP